MNRKRIPYGTKLPVHFSQAELNDIREHTFAPDFANHAIVEGKRLRVDLSLDDIEEIQGCVAAEANWTSRNPIGESFANFVRQPSNVTLALCVTSCNSSRPPVEPTLKFAIRALTNVRQKRCHGF